MTIGMAVVIRSRRCGGAADRKSTASRRAKIARSRTSSWRCAANLYGSRRRRHRRSWPPARWRRSPSRRRAASDRRRQRSPTKPASTSTALQNQATRIMSRRYRLDRRRITRQAFPPLWCTRRELSFMLEGRYSTPVPPFGSADESDCRQRPAGRPASRSRWWTITAGRSRSDPTREAKSGRSRASNRNMRGRVTDIALRRARSTPSSLRSTRSWTCRHGSTRSSQYVAADADERRKGQGAVLRVALTSAADFRGAPAPRHPALLLAAYIARPAMPRPSSN